MTNDNRVWTDEEVEAMPDWLAECVVLHGEKRLHMFVLVDDELTRRRDANSPLNRAKAIAVAARAKRARSGM